MAFIVPSWMDKSFFEKAIRHSEKDAEAEVINFNVVNGAKPGEHFGSTVYKAAVTFKSKYTKDEKSSNFFIKGKPQYDIPAQLAGVEGMQTEVFRREMEMYGNILPQIQSLLKAAGDNETLSPRLIYQCNEPSPTIVLEDLSVDGFAALERPPEDFELSKKIIRRLAKFHAASFYLANEQHMDFTGFDSSSFQNEAAMDMVFTEGLIAFTDVVKEWEGCEKFVTHLEKFIKSYKMKARRTYSPNRNEFGFNVLNHADFHVKNVLLKKNENDVGQEIFIIDYQVLIYASPAIDLIYALHYFLTPENRQAHRDEFIACYYEQFAMSLKSFGYLKKPPSLMDFQVELLRNGSMEVLVAICMEIFFYIDFKSFTPEDMDMGEGTKRAKRRMYNNPIFKEMIMKELPRFLYNGFI